MLLWQKYSSGNCKDVDIECNTDILVLKFGLRIKCFKKPYNLRLDHLQKQRRSRETKKKSKEKKK